MYQLLSGDRTFGELRGLLPGISDRVLTTQLTELHADDIVSATRSGRKVFYRLTSAGLGLRGVFEAMGIWGLERLRGSEDSNARNEVQQAFLS